MGRCEICGNEGSRIQVNHKEHGKIMVCRDCWMDIYEKGQKICEGTGTNSSGFSSTCSCCR